jgi:hypothetical protein
LQRILEQLLEIRAALGDARLGGGAELDRHAPPGDAVDKIECQVGARVELQHYYLPSKAALEDWSEDSTGIRTGSQFCRRPEPSRESPVIRKAGSSARRAD